MHRLCSALTRGRGVTKANSTEWITCEGTILKLHVIDKALGRARALSIQHDIKPCT